MNSRKNSENNTESKLPHNDEIKNKSNKFKTSNTKISDDLSPALTNNSDKIVKNIKISKKRKLETLASTNYSSKKVKSNKYFPLFKIPSENDDKSYSDATTSEKSPLSTEASSIGIDGSNDFSSWQGPPGRN